VKSGNLPAGKVLNPTVLPKDEEMLRLSEEGRFFMEERWK